MDIYSFINSRDVAEYCRNINHQFTAIENAFIVYRSKKHNLREKHDAYREIIATMPDTEVPKRFNCPYYDSLHSVLRKFVNIESCILSDFKLDTDAAVYQFGVYYTNYMSGELREVHKLYSTLSGTLADIKALKAGDDALSPNDGLEKCLITKRWIDTEDCIEVLVTPDGEPLSCVSHCLNEKDYNISIFFDGLWIDIPTPFVTGDILAANPDSTTNDCAHENVPFVLTNICYRNASENLYKYLHEQADCTDMTASGLFLDEGSHIYSECMHAYQDLEYYRGNLNGRRRILTALSNHIKGEISTDLLLNAYALILNETQRKDTELLTEMYTEEGRALAGLEESDEENNY